MKTLFVLLYLLAGPALAETAVYTDLRAYDGDTLRSTYVPIKGLPAISFRLMGIDTPELRGKCEKEKQLAILARDFLHNEVAGKPVTVDFLRWDKYGGRVIVRAYNVDGQDLTEKLIATGHGYPYNGGFKRSWCN
jgi:endonuclease YncB( thermonuclease family)